MKKTNYIFNLLYPYNTEYNNDLNFSLNNEKINNNLYIGRSF